MNASGAPGLHLSALGGGSTTQGGQGSRLLLTSPSPDASTGLETFVPENSTPLLTRESFTSYQLRLRIKRNDRIGPHGL